LGIEPVLTADHGASTAFYYNDPDGNSVELTVDNFGDWDKSSEYMRTSPEFAICPMGTYVDPEKIIKAARPECRLKSCISAATPVNSLHTRTLGH
jgi:catechol 2,3-dioxygenase